MTTPTTIARPYAKAAFEAAVSEKQLPAWSQELKNLSLAASDARTQSVLKNPNYTKKQLADLLISLAPISSSIQNFIFVLAEKNRLSLLPAISMLFEEMYAKQLGHLALTVTSAFAMNDEQKAGVKQKLSKQFNSECDIEFKIDQSIMGGLLIRSNNWVLDSTIKGALERLKSALI